MPSKTTPVDIQSVPGCPKGVAIYRIGASRMWQFRWYVGRGYVRQSLGTDNVKEAKVRAKELFAEFLTKDRTVGVRPNTFGAVTVDFLIWQEAQVKMRKLSTRWHDEDVYKIKKDIGPFFNSHDIASIDRTSIDGFLAQISGRELSKSTLNKYVSLLKKILRFAADRHIITYMPSFPRVGTDHNARPYFDLESYRKLREAARHDSRTGATHPYILNRGKVRNLHYCMDFYDFIVFSTNVFIRLSDVKDLKHKNIIVSDGAERYLELFPPSSKTSDRSSFSMPNAVGIYKRLLERHQRVGSGTPDDYVFYPKHKNRNYMLQNLSRLFVNLLERHNLREDQRGNNRTLYSLRHTALMYRFLYGDNINILTLAQNALTSVDMLQSFYLSHATSRMKLAELQSFKNNTGRA